ncbi:hypothetical protein MAM1_0021c01821 [Mucor ambiguus]|uniref:Uncharacterized protein n=1 Tax=Mucor ambiguus TaxID=91626 RepID=A0A0C9MKJ7_9FUNG|nr:hypothetical protein MAM1_0021c01821 [Mucor ambiguus]
MSSKRNHASNNGGSGYSNRNPNRGQNRDKSQRPPQKSYGKFASFVILDQMAINLDIYKKAEPSLSNETRAVQLLKRIFNDEDDSLFSRRIGNANQLLKMLEESRRTVSDSLEFRQEQKQLLDICVYDEGLRRIIEFAKAPPALRNTMLKIVSGLACYTRLDLALSWIFDRLSVWETSINDANKDREWKKWLLRLLKQASERYYKILIDSAADQYTYKQTLEMSPMILASIISFLDTMNSSDYLSTVVEILVYFSENYQNIFGQRFNDIIDLLVGWNMDPELSESKRATIVASYSKFSVFWAGYLPFAVELLNHFLTDMQTLIRELTSTRTPEAQAKQWTACASLLR